MLASLTITLALLPALQAVPQAHAETGQQARSIGGADRTSAAVAALPQETDAAAASGSGADAAWQRGTLEMGGLVGYAKGKVYDPQRTPTSFVQALGRLGVHFGPTGDGAMRGNFAIVVEGGGMSIDQEPRASGGAINLLIRYTWAAEKWRPSLLFGAGMLFTDEQVPPGETTKNYSPQGGVGLQYLVRDHLAVGGEYRFHHISNKGQTETNPGINTHLVLFGVSWFR